MEYKFNMDDEVICDHLVTSQIKKVWAKQLEMVSKFAEVCEKHGLKWFASGGTLIGAVRHKGYIPWDDDIDIHMIVDDYEKFCAIASEELKPYFWQECRTEPGYSPRHGKIRDPRTTGATGFERENWADSMNKGIFIDIFPLYYIPDDPQVRRKQQRKLKRLYHIVWLFHRMSSADKYKREKMKTFSGLKKLKWRLFWLLSAIEFFFVKLFYTEAKVNREFQETCRIQRTPTDYVGATSFDWGEPRFVWPAYNYREMVDLPFMGATIKAPIEWDACLKQQYGDYMVIKKGSSMHSDILFDVDTPYEEKLKDKGKSPNA